MQRALISTTVALVLAAALSASAGAQGRGWGGGGGGAVRRRRCRGRWWRRRRWCRGRRWWWRCAGAVAGRQLEVGAQLAAADLAWRSPAAGVEQQAAGAGCAPHLRAAATLRRAAAEIGRAGATGKAIANWQGGNWQHGGRHFRRGPVVTYGFGAPYYDYASPYSYYYGDDCYALRFIRGAYRRVWVCN